MYFSIYGLLDDELLEIDHFIFVDPLQIAMNDKNDTLFGYILIPTIPTL